MSVTSEEFTATWTTGRCRARSTFAGGARAAACRPRRASASVYTDRRRARCVRMDEYMSRRRRPRRRGAAGLGDVAGERASGAAAAWRRLTGASSARCSRSCGQGLGSYRPPVVCLGRCQNIWGTTDTPRGSKASRTRGSRLDLWLGALLGTPGVSRSSVSSPASLVGRRERGRRSIS